MNTTDRTRPAGSDTIEAAPLRGLSESDRTLLIVDDDADQLSVGAALPAPRHSPTTIG